MTTLCVKHKLFSDYGILFLEHGILKCTSKSHESIWVQMVDFFKDGMTKAWTGYEQSECTCGSSTVAATSTFRMGASWASELGSGDVGNLNDFEEYPDDFAHHFHPSRS